MKFSLCIAALFAASASAFAPSATTSTSSSSALHMSSNYYGTGSSNYYGSGDRFSNKSTNFRRGNEQRSALYSDRDRADRTSAAYGTGSGSDAVKRNLENRLDALNRGSRATSSYTGSRYTTGSTPYDADKVWDRSTPVTVQGGSLKTWSFASTALERVQVLLKSDGRPVDCDVELWQGPDNTPVKMRVYVEDGSSRTFNTVIGTPRGPNTIAIRNIGHMEFPLLAVIKGEADPVDKTLDMAKNAGYDYQSNNVRTIQGGALKTYPFEAYIESVQILLQTDGRPLNARIELLQGPNNNKQVVELYTEDGMDRPFYAILETPGSGNVVRVVNTATVEFPLTAFVEPYAAGNPADMGIDPVISG